MAKTLKSKDHALGCLVGGMIGDAVGAFLEFNPTPINKKNIRKALSLPGGGPHNTAPGQVTDDSELMLSLCDGLCKTNPNCEFPFERVAQQYIAWLRSDPFDIGKTCQAAFSNSRGAQDMKSNACNFNMKSEANGALMRCAPIAVWCGAHFISIEQTADHARADASLSHPNPICQECNAILVALLSDIIIHHGDVNNALLLLTSLKQTTHPLVKEWIHYGLNKPLKGFNCNNKMGHVKHAFMLAIHFIKYANEYTYEQAIAKVLAKGGDTDTNACIVGYVMGAVCGFSSLPNKLKKKILEFDCSTHDPEETLLGYNRPVSYKASNVVSFVESMFS